MSKLIILILLFNVAEAICFAQDNHFVTLGNVKSRPIALGGAFTSVQDDIEAVLYNPGTFTLYEMKKDFRITFYLNPISTFAAFREYSRSFQQPINKLNSKNASALLVKAIIISSRFFHTGFIFGEECLHKIDGQQNLQFFKVDDFWNNSSNTFFMCLELAKRVSIGISGTLYHERMEDELRNGFGYSYGIMLKPSTKINVGLSYIDFPENIPDFRKPLERLEDETMNIGISYRPISSIICSIDIRNLTEENKENVRELHVGLEQTIFRLAALRFGFFKERFSTNNNYSIGIGILNSNLFHKQTNQLDHHDFSINYSLVYREKLHSFDRWHFFSFLLRI